MNLHAVKNYVPCVAFKNDADVVTVIKTGNVRYAMQYAVSIRSNYTVAFWMLLVVLNSFGEGCYNRNLTLYVFRAVVLHTRLCLQLIAR